MTFNIAMTHTMPHSDFLSIIKSRGFLHQLTDESGLAEYLKTPGGIAYIGFDCTAPSLHVGSLVQIMLLRWWQKCGHKPVVLMGGGTTKIGDPSGKDEARPALTDELINTNMAGIKQVFTQFLTFGEGKSDAVMVNNDAWLSSLNYLDFLRRIAPHFSVNRMLTMDSVKLRLEREQPLSLLEFNYMVLQAYDFVELNQRINCRVQMGGSDQWGNIVQGIELSRRTSAGKAPEVFGITSPLMTTSSGAKMGKTASGAVWLNADLLSPYDYWQFWRNTEDADVGRFLKLFTELSLEEIAKLETLQGAEINEAKKILATEATALLHGREAAEKAAKTAQETFEAGGTSADLPEVALPAAEIASGIPAHKLFMLAGLATSGGEARRLIAGKGARVNDTVIETAEQQITRADITAEGYIKLSSGKKKHVLAKFH
jgi:tyrosyl-tRNA synthetase